MSTTITPNHAAAAPSPSSAVAAQHEGPGLVPSPAPHVFPREPRCEMEMRDWWRERQGEEWRLL